MTTEIKTSARAGPPPLTFPEPVPLSNRELRPALAAAGAGLLAALTWTMWQSTGSRLSLFVCAATLAAAVVDIVWAVVASGRVQLLVTANPPEATVGDTVAIRLEVRGPRQYLDVRVLTFGTVSRGVDVPDTSDVGGTAARREVLDAVGVEVVGRGLAGVVACARRRTVPLRRPLYVGPRPVPAAEHFPELYRTWGEGQARPAPTGDLVRGVRPYVAGDPMRKVHWRATARDLAGDLVVKEVEETGAPRLMVVLDLSSGGVAAERAAGRAAWYADEGLRRGYLVVLATAERPGPVTGPVNTTSDVIHRLAAASAPGRATLPSPDQPGGIVVVTEQGDTWR